MTTLIYNRSVSVYIDQSRIIKEIDSSREDSMTASNTKKNKKTFKKLIISSIMLLVEIKIKVG